MKTAVPKATNILKMYRKLAAYEDLEKRGMLQKWNRISNNLTFLLCKALICLPADESVRILFIFSKAGDIMDIYDPFLPKKSFSRLQQLPSLFREPAPGISPGYLHYGFWQSMRIAARQRRYRKQLWWVFMDFSWSCSRPFFKRMTGFYHEFKKRDRAGGVHRSEDGGPGGPADGLCAAPARARRQSRFQSRKARKTPGHVPVIRGLKIHTLLGIYPRKYGKFSTFLIFAKSYFREKLQ